jgi:hypothetical protein
VTTWAGEPHNAGDEHVQLRWFSEAELATLANLAAYDYPRLAGLACEIGRRRQD